MTLRSKVVRGSFWVVAFRWAARLLGLLNVAIIARILSPEDFGLLAMAMLVMGFIEAWLAFGLENACVQRRELERGHLDTAWTMRLIQGAVVTLLVAIAAPFAADYFRDERVTLLIWILCAGIFISSMGNIGVVLFRREMDFRSEFKLQLAAKLIGFSLGLGAALWLRNYWALVIGILSGITATTTLSYAMHPFRPRLDLSHWRELWHFSKWMFVVNIAQFAEIRADEALVGRLGAEELGLYAVASDLGQMPVNEIAAPVNRVLFPAFSTVQDDPERLGTSYLKTLEVVAFVTLPAGVGLALVAKPAIALLLGAKWLPAATVLSLIALFSVCRSVSSTATSLFFALGRPKLVAGLSLFGLVTFVAAGVPLAAHSGAQGVALAKLLAGALATLAALVTVTRYARIRAIDLMKRFLRPTLGTISMVITVQLLSASGQFGLVVSLVVPVLLGAGAFLLTVGTVWLAMGRPDGPEGLFVDAVVHRTERGVFGG